MILKILDVLSAVMAAWVLEQLGYLVFLHHLFVRQMYGFMSHPGLVFWKVDNVIYRRNLYPVDNTISFPNTYLLNSELFSGYNTIQPLNWGLLGKKTVVGSVHFPDGARNMGNIFNAIIYYIICLTAMLNY